MTDQPEPVLVAGASGALGSCVAEALAVPGRTVGLSFFSNEAALHEVSLKVKARGATPMPVRFDARNREETEQAVRGFANRAGKLRAAVCCIGSSRRGPLLSFKESNWDEVIAINLTGPANFLRAVMRAMGPPAKSQHMNSSTHQLPSSPTRGIILLVGSAAGVVGQAGGCAYSAAKAGLLALVRSVTLEQRERYGPEVRVVLPGYMEAGIGTGVGEEFLGNFEAESVSGRPQDVRKAAGMIARFIEKPFDAGTVLSLDSRTFSRL